MRLLERFQTHSLYADMSGAGRRLHEVPYSLVAENGHVESGIVDALYQRDGRWTVVEFKTDKIRNEAKLRALLAETDYLFQAERYAVAVERLLGSQPAVILCFLTMPAGCEHSTSAVNEQRQRACSLVNGPEESVMYGLSELKPKIRVTDTTVECPVSGCAVTVPRQHNVFRPAGSSAVPITASTFLRPPGNMIMSRTTCCGTMQESWSDWRRSSA